MGIKEEGKIIKCEDCNDTENIYYVPCPYDLEIHEETNWVYLCEECYEEREDDI
jgi:hypothetical protein